MNIVIDGLLINYASTGSGKKVLLCLHGWGDSSKTFESLARQLDSDYQIIAPDLPGFGGSETPREPWQLDDFASFAASFAGKLGIVPYGVIGHSNGGAIAIRALASHKLHAQKLVLLASAGIRRPSSLRNRGFSMLAKPAKLVLKAAPRSTQKRIKQKFYKAIGSDYMVAEHMQQTFRNIVSTDVLEDAKKLQVPAILIYGQDDSSTPPAYGKLFSEAISGSALHVIENTGHFVHQEQVYKVADQVKGFLR